MLKLTPLHSCHQAQRAKLVDFAGWEMPLHYGSQVTEHHYVRQDAGLFDVSHMTIVDCHGPDAKAFLQYVLANDVGRLTPGKALYTCMLHERGGVIDDLIVYHLADASYRLIVNSATHDKDLVWLNKQSASFNITLTERTELAMLAVQGPKAKEKLATVFDPSFYQAVMQLKPFHAVQGAEVFIARTGYTGEDGFEVILDQTLAPTFWERLVAAGFHPCGLGARDTLRLEAGLNLYGADMDETVTPLESNLGWTIAWEPATRDFIGRAALTEQKAAGPIKQLVGLVLLQPGVLRNHQAVLVDGKVVGEITSGSFSPTLNKGIALARIERSAVLQCAVDVRGKQIPAQIVKPPFVRQGQSNVYPSDLKMRF